jgi:hypothetical protein
MCERGEIAMCHLVFLWLHISCAWHKTWALYAMLAWPPFQHRMCDVIPSIQALSTTWSIDPQWACCCDPVDVFHTSIHPSTLSSTWSSVGLLACCETKTLAGRGQNEHPCAWVHRRWHHRNRYWWSTPAAHLSSTLLSLFIVHMFFLNVFF